MKITFDPANHAANIRNRGLSFDLVDELDWASAVILEDSRKDYGERRFRVFISAIDSMCWSSRRAAMPCMSSVSERPTTGRSNVMVKHSKPDPELIDDENPEWTAKDFRAAKPATAVLPEIFGATVAAQVLQPRRGRPPSANPKAHVNLRLDSEVVEAFRATGRGWQTRLNAALKDWLKTHSPA